MGSSFAWNFKTFILFPNNIKWLFLNNCLDKFTLKLSNITWNNIKVLQNVNDAYSKFIEVFLSLYNECFSKIKVKLKPQRQFNPWITNSIGKSSKKKQNLYEKFLKKRTIQSEAEYKVYKNMLKSIKHKSKISYNLQKIIESKNNLKKNNIEYYERTDK